MSNVTYAIACVVVPALWGLVMFYVFGWVDRRWRKRATSGEVPPPIDYSI